MVQEEDQRFKSVSGYADKNKIEGIGYQNIRNSNIRIFETRSNTRINQFPKRFENLNFEELKFVSNIRTFEDSRLTPEKIYNNYLLAFKKGVYNYIKEDIDPITQQSIPRKYFSGGFDAALITPTLETAPASKLPLKLDRAQIIEVE